MKPNAVPAALVLAAALACTACAQVGKYTLRFDAEGLRRARERVQREDAPHVSIETDSGRVLSSAYLRVIETKPDGREAQRWRDPVSFSAGLPAGEGGATLVVVERRRGEPNKKLVAGGKYTAIAGGAVGAVGLLLGIGAVLVAGPANDTHRVGYAGAIVLGAGATIALVGGTIALVGIAPGGEAA